MTSITSDLLQDALGRQRAGEFAGAAERYRALLQADPNHSDALYYLAQTLCQQGDLVGGIEAIERALALEPCRGRLHNLRGMALNALGRPEEALASFEYAIACEPSLAMAHANRGDALLESGRVGEAINSYDAAVTLDPRSAETWCNRGAALQELGRDQEALASYRRATDLKPDFAEVYVNSGHAELRLGQLDNALRSFESALAASPALAEALIGRGEVLLRLGRPADALTNFEQASAVTPHSAAALVGCARALVALQLYAEALVNFDRVLVNDGGNVDAACGRGFVLNRLGRPMEALSTCERTLAISPRHVATLVNRADALLALDRPEDALASSDNALKNSPNEIEALLARGQALYALKRFDEVLLNSETALATAPSRSDLIALRANALFALNRYEDALACYEEILRLDPKNADAWYNRGLTLHLLNRWAEAIRCHQKALEIRPSHPEARFGLCTAQLPILYETEIEIDERRAAYVRELDGLSDYVNGMQSPGDLAQGVGSNQPFFLAYQAHNDRVLQSRYGTLVCRIMAERYPAPKLPPCPEPGEPIKVGIVSGFFRFHTVWRMLIKGWLTQLDRKRFRMFGYYTRGERDAETTLAAESCERFVHGPLSVATWRAEIISDAPHVLIYPEIGMERASAQLAAQRLAAVQCTSYGHTETSGLPTMDYFLSSELMEPSGAQEHYSERLIRLPHLSIYYEPYLPIEPQPRHARSKYNLRPDAVVYWCGQSLFKFLPQFDDVFPRIAREVGVCQFLFFEDHRSRRVTEIFRERIRRAFFARGLNAEDYCSVLPRVDLSGFCEIAAASGVALDSIGWSGGQTTLDCLLNDLPVVTLNGNLLRGRQSAAMLAMAGIAETITTNIDDYVSVAVRLGLDDVLRAKIKHLISVNKHRLYRDSSAIEGLEAFLDRAVRFSG